MIHYGSRYYKLADRTLLEGDRQVVYKERRFLPRAAAGAPSFEAEVVPGDRPDLLAARTLQTPELFWRLCDANGVMRPAELTATPGRRIRVPLPGA